MSCVIDKNGNAIAPNGKPSNLLKELRDKMNSNARAEAIYESIYNTEGAFKKFYGDFQVKGEVSPENLDENGEPKLFVDNGVYGFLNDKQEFYAVEVYDREKSKVLELLQDNENDNRKLQGELVNTIMYFIHEVKKDFTKKGIPFNSETVNSLFNLDTDLDKDTVVALKDKLLLGAFNNLSDQNQEDINKAKELVEILQDRGPQAMIDEANSKDIILNKDTWETFFMGYMQWDSKEDKIGNIKSLGLRQLVKDSLYNYNLRLKDGVSEEILQEEDQEVIRIYGQSRLQDNPKDKLTAKAKAILSNVISGTNSFGYPRILPSDAVYQTVQEATVGQPDVNSMITSLETMVRYSPEKQAILDRFKGLEKGDLASIFTAFKLSYTQFYLFKQRENAKTGLLETIIIDSNQNRSIKAIRQSYKDNSVEEGGIKNNKAIYIKDVNNNLVVKPEKLKILQNSWKTIEEALNKGWETHHIEALGTYLWEVGMDLGPTLEATQENLKTYYELGEGIFTGNAALNRFVNLPGFNFRKFLTHLESGKTQNLYDSERSTIEKVAQVSLLFDQKPFSSFITGTLKQVFPINLPTPLDEITELFNDPKQEKELDEYLQALKKDPFFNPGALTQHQEDSKYMSFFLQTMDSIEGRKEKIREKFINYTLDSIKRNDKPYAFDYESQSPKLSLIGRLIAHNNRGGRSGELFGLVAPHIQSTRPRLNYVQMPKATKLKQFGVDNYSKRGVIERFIIQDLARMHRALTELEYAQKNGDTSKLIADFHYDSKNEDKYQRDGGAFTMTQIFNLNENGQAEEAAKNLQDFLNQSEGTYTEQKKVREFIDSEIIKVENNLEAYEQEIAALIQTYDINLKEDVDQKIGDPNAFIKDFVFNDFALRTELTKYIRSGYSYSTSFSKFIKRMHLLNTPGSKLLLQGYDRNNPNYGMMPTYNALVIKDMDFIYTEDAMQTADNMLKNLVAAGVSKSEAESISNAYRSLNKTDAQTFISLPMYRGIMQGLGKWDDKLDEDAYQEYLKGGNFNRPVMPLKPYHEQLDVKNDTSQFEADKNSYVVVTPELAKDFPKLLSMLNTFEKDNIHVVHTESATKTARSNVQDFANLDELDSSNPMIKNSKSLRFPQMIPIKTSKEAIFNKQIRKNLPANIVKNGTYTVAGIPMPGYKLQEILGKAIQDNINEDTKNLRTKLNISKLRSIKDRNTTEYSLEKMTHLKELRSEIQKAIEERDLSNNYLDALDIFPINNYDHEFKIPLSFPNYASKFEGIVTNLYNREIFKQMLPGTEVVQIAELGGHITSRELQMYDGSNEGAQVRIKASLLGFTAKEIEGKTAAGFEGDSRLEFIGYRIPEQGKNSAVVMKVVDFLPENYEKAIMVPGGLTRQMGSDFDIDKLFLIFQETLKTKPGTRVKPDYTENAVNNRKQRNNMIYDVFKSILTDPKHLKEVLKPLSAESLEKRAESIRKDLGITLDLDYNNPATQLVLETRNKVGKAGIGLKSNLLAGRNVAEPLGKLTLKKSQGFNPSKNVFFDNIIYDKVGVTKDSEGVYTDETISKFLSASVDAGTNPIQLDLNDNKYTTPVSSLLLSVGLPENTTINFIAQPILKEVVKQAELLDLAPGKIHIAIEAVRSMFDMPALKPLALNINNEELLVNFKSELGNEMDNKILASFEDYHATGRQLQQVYKLITPDTRGNLNEISAINAYLDEENKFLFNTSFQRIEGASYYIHHMKSPNPIANGNIAFRGIFDVILRDTKQMGFIQKSLAFDKFKRDLRIVLNLDYLNAEQHKFIDRVLYHKIMALPHSPFMQERGDKPGLTSKETIQNLYDPNNSNNIVTTFRNLKIKYPSLNNNMFMNALKADPTNAENKIALLQFDMGTDLSTADKNSLSEALLSLIKDTNPEISEFGKLLVANQIITHGYFPTYGSYIDLIPSEVITTDILNPGKDSPVEFWKKETATLDVGTYTNFDNFVHEFIRHYGTKRPGRVNLIDIVKLKKGEVLQSGKINFAKKDSRVYIKGSKRYKNYFKNVKDQLFVLVDSENDAVIYQKLQHLGIPNKINELGILSSSSLFEKNKIAFTTPIAPIELYETENHTDPKQFDNTKEGDDSVVDDETVRVNCN